MPNAGALLPSWLAHRRAVLVWHRRSRLALVAFAAAGLGLLLGATDCKRHGGTAPPAPSAAPPAGLTPEQAEQVLAKVGDQTITLGDYAATLERMGQIDRLRYQSPERRRELLDEIINMELLAQDARDKGLDKKPETQQVIRQILRDALLEQVRRDLPPPDALPLVEVRAYYESHRDDFREPERRRVGHILLRDAATADKVVAQAAHATPAQWGALVGKYSIDAQASPGAPPPPAELAGDLGIVSAPGEPRGANPRVPEPVRAAAFELKQVGDVLDHPVRAADGFHVVRLGGKTEPRDRSFSEAERTIRIALLQAKIAERETALREELTREFAVTIDEQALSSIALPTGDQERDAGAAAVPSPRLH